MPLLPTALIVHGQPATGQSAPRHSAHITFNTRADAAGENESGYNMTATAAAATRFIHRQHAGKGTRRSQATFQRRAPSQEQEQESGQT